MGTFADIFAIYDFAAPFDPLATSQQAASVSNASAAEAATSINGRHSVNGQHSLNGHAAAPAAIIANEADNDPHRLARVYLSTNSRTLRYWRQEWWKYDGRRYIRFSEDELAAEVNFACKSEFDRINLAALQSPDSANGDGKLPEALKVARGLVSNVIGALEGLCLVSGATEQPAWIGEPPQPGASSHCISLTNGILDLDRLLAGEEDRSKVLLPHSPAWFSPITLAYEFNEESDCPKWDAFLAKNLEGDEERISVLQEWAGYLLLPDTSQQKFLFLEGEGSNGKSVYYAAIEAMLGQENVSHVPLESFDGEFTLNTTLGKLANIAADCGDLDKAAEGVLKSFTSGDRMTFNRKGLTLIDATPTARLMIAANNRPNFSDRSRGIWRRMILIPFEVEIEEEEKVKGMDKPEWWEKSGELPGILTWAIAGLDRLRTNGRFTESALGSAAIESYRTQFNSARGFLLEACDFLGTQGISTKLLYGLYRQWCTESGYQPFNSTNFGIEVFRAFPEVKKARPRISGERVNEYKGLVLKDAEITVEG